MTNNNSPKSPRYYRVQGVVRFWFWTLSTATASTLIILADGYGRDWQ
jgi:hypothetical protein